MDNTDASADKRVELQPERLEEVKENHSAGSRWENTLVFLICVGLSVYGLLTHKPLTIVFVVLASITALWAGKHWYSWIKQHAKRGEPQKEKREPVLAPQASRWPSDISSGARHFAASVSEIVKAPRRVGPIKSKPGLQHLLHQHRLQRTPGRLIDSIGLVAFALLFFIFYSLSGKSVPVPVILEFGVLLSGMAGCFYFFPEKTVRFSRVRTPETAGFSFNMLMIDLGPLIGPMLLFFGAFLRMVWLNRKLGQSQMIILIACVGGGAIMLPWIAAYLWRRRYREPNPKQPNYFTWAMLGFWSMCVFILVNLIVGLLWKLEVF